MRADDRPPRTAGSPCQSSGTCAPLPLAGRIAWANCPNRADFDGQFRLRYSALHRRYHSCRGITLQANHTTGMTIRLHRGDLPDLARYASGAVAIDTETMGLNLGRDRLCLVQLSPGDGSADVVQIPAHAS